MSKTALIAGQGVLPGILATFLLCMAVLWITEVQGKSTMMWLFDRFIQPWAGDKPGGLHYALLFMALVWCVGWWLDQRRLYIRL